MAERMITIKELGKLLGKDSVTVLKWLTNTSQPTLDNLIEIARVLKCDIGELVRKDDSIVIEKQGE